MSSKTKSSPPAKKKKPYTAPKLVKYGDVSALIQAGSQGGHEGSMSMSTMGSDMAMSDRLTKECAVRIGTHPLGLGLYLFDYKPEFRDACGHGRQFGVMADEVAAVMPAAVSRGPLGYQQVDYALLGVRRFAR